MDRLIRKLLRFLKKREEKRMTAKPDRVLSQAIDCLIYLIEYFRGRSS